MDKDKFEPQSGGVHVHEGHEESDLSVRGIVLFGVFLAVGGVVSFVLMIAMIHIMENWERDHQARLTPVEKQMQAERDMPREGLGKQVPAPEGGLKPPPDWYGRGKIEDHINRTFKTPLTPILQYNDEHDMAVFAGSEENWLKSSGRGANGSIHIPIQNAMESLAKNGLPQVSGPWQPANMGAPSAAYPTGAADTGQPRGNTGGNK